MYLLFCLLRIQIASSKICNEQVPYLNITSKSGCYIKVNESYIEVYTKYGTVIDGQRLCQSFCGETIEDQANSNLNFTFEDYYSRPPLTIACRRKATSSDIFEMNASKLPSLLDTYWVGQAMNVMEKIK